jgi:hypothetical protein
MTRGVLLSVLIVLVTGQFALQETVLRPEEDLHRVQGQSPGCDSLADYVDSFNSTIDEHRDYFDFFVSGDLDAVPSMEPEELESLVADGDELLTALDELDVPGTYRVGHGGFRLLFSTVRDYVYFLGLDTSTVPNIFAYNRGLQLIYEGELQAAAQCPAEVEDVGGYVQYDPATLGPELEGN